MLTQDADATFAFVSELGGSSREAMALRELFSQNESGCRRIAAIWSTRRALVIDAPQSYVGIAIA